MSEEDISKKNEDEQIYNKIKSLEEDIVKLKEENFKLIELVKDKDNSLLRLGNINRNLTSNLEEISKFLDKIIETKILKNKNNSPKRENSINDIMKLHKAEIDNAYKQIKFLTNDNTHLKDIIKNLNCNRELNDNLEKENNELKKEINKLKMENNENKNKIRHLSKQVSSFNDKENERYLKEYKIKELNNEINLHKIFNKTNGNLKRQLNSINKKEEERQKIINKINSDKINIIFIVKGEEKEIECYEKDKFYEAEEKLYKIYPEFRDTDNFFYWNREKIFKV